MNYGPSPMFRAQKEVADDVGNSMAKTALRSIES
jgi:hypothetical protein